MRRFRLTAPKITENDVERACVDLLRWHHKQPVRIASGKYLMPDRPVLEACQRAGVTARWITIGEPGIPDYCIPAWFLEVKRPGGALSGEQQLKIMDLERTWGLETAVVESVDELAEWLAHYRKL